MEFCTKTFGAEQALQRFCYDRMIQGANHPGSPHRVEENAAVEAPTLQDAMSTAAEEGLEGAPELAMLLPPGLPHQTQTFAVEPVAPFQPLAHHAPQALMAAAARVQAGGQGKPGDVEVTAGSLAQSIKDAHDMGFTGSPKAIVYHHADGEEDVYAKAPAGESGEMLAEAPRSITVDGPTFKASVDKAHAMGLHGSPNAVVYHPANGAPQTYELAGEYHTGVDVPMRTKHRA
mmetsp:Transcript_29561/g.59658  ORF Transcript_29561/g.59658 Transcript_29561/m.59658 type:complete len:232 (-) Transcript_29561:160-855(-)